MSHTPSPANQTIEGIVPENFPSSEEFYRDLKLDAWLSRHSRTLEPCIWVEAYDDGRPIYIESFDWPYDTDGNNAPPWARRHIQVIVNDVVREALDYAIDAYDFWRTAK